MANNINPDNAIENAASVLASTIQALSLKMTGNPNTMGEKVITRLVDRALRNNIPGHSLVSTAAAPRKSPLPLKKLVTKDYVVCLEDNKKLRTLTRHLKSAFGLTPAQYRERWNLPADFPMTCYAMSEKQRKSAIRMGLGHKLAEARKVSRARIAEEGPRRGPGRPRKLTTTKALKKAA